MLRTFGPYGDLGRAEERTNPDEFVEKAIRAAHFLRAVADVALNQNFDVTKGLSYAIEVPVNGLGLVSLDYAQSKFPPGVSFYGSGGIRLFDLRGAGGGVATAQICYIICIPKEE